MTLNELFNKRQTNYIKEMMKYGRLIFNDHFVLILLLLLGAGGFTYSNYLDTLALGDYAPRIFVAFLYYLIVSMGSVNLLLEPADQIYLLPKEFAFKDIFKKKTAQSFILSLLLVGIITVITWPIFVTTLAVPTIDILFIFIVLASLKSLNLFVKVLPFFEKNQDRLRKAQMGMTVIKVLTILSLVFFNIKATSLLILVVALVVGYLFFSDKLFSSQLFNWAVMIEAEEKRLQRVYRLISMFATVPHIETSIKRVSWLDPALNWLSRRKPTAPYFYLLRTTARNSDYSMLVIRATIVGAILLATTGALVISSLLLLLFLYMIGFQLISLITEIDRLPQFKMYPIKQETKEKAVYDLIFQLLIFVSIFLGLTSTFSLGILGLSLIPIGFGFAYVFSTFYAPSRVKKVY